MLRAERVGLLTIPDRLSRGGDRRLAAILVAGAGYFYDSHRAANECLAAIELLAAPLPTNGATGLSKLLETTRNPTWRIWAENSPFDLKDVLKARDYRWNPDGTPFPKAWFIDVSDNDRDAELNFLQKEINQREIEPHHAQD